MFAYLITSKDYYGDLSDSNLSYFKQKIIYANNKIAKLNIGFATSIKLKFACLRYNNSYNAKQILSSKEWNLIRTFLSICETLNIVATINLSHAKLDILHIMQDNGMSAGIHLKDADMPLIEKVLPLLTKSNKTNENLTPLIYSAHSIDNVKMSIKLGADFATISPIFYEKNGNKALGIKIFGELDSRLKSRIIALGGITTDKKVLLIQQCKIAGFASIGYFLQN
ncbi:thiamine phosphate synthase [Helicobacter muridarum]|nr:thiamine phosphate synthase [Helicobacter muridarum]